MATIFLLIYVFYVILTYITDKPAEESVSGNDDYTKMDETKKIELPKAELVESEDGDGDFDNVVMTGEPGEKKENKLFINIVQEKLNGSGFGTPVASGRNIDIEVEPLAKSQDHHNEIVSRFNQSQVDNAKTLGELLSPYLRPKKSDTTVEKDCANVLLHAIKALLMTKLEYRKKSIVTGCLKKFFDWLDLPFKAFLYLTCLPVENDQWSGIRVGVYPIPGIYFCLFVFTKVLTGMPYLTWGIPMIVVLYLVI